MQIKLVFKVKSTFENIKVETLANTKETKTQDKQEQKKEEEREI